MDRSIDLAVQHKKQEYFMMIEMFTTCPRDLRLARKAGGKISSQEAILTESPFAALLLKVVFNKRSLL